MLHQIGHSADDEENGTHPPGSSQDQSEYAATAHLFGQIQSCTAAPHVSDTTAYSAYPLWLQFDECLYPEDYCLGFGPPPHSSLLVSCLNFHSSGSLA
jgi:hypothetical protein